MTKTIILCFICTSVGAIIGFIVSALLSMASKDDAIQEKALNKDNKLEVEKNVETQVR